MWNILWKNALVLYKQRLRMNLWSQVYLSVDLSDDFYENQTIKMSLKPTDTNPVIRIDAFTGLRGLRTRLQAGGHESVQHQSTQSKLAPSSSSKLEDDISFNYFVLPGK